MTRPQINQKIDLTIRDFGCNGEGVGDFDGYTVFVDAALPGERIEARLTECNKSYGRARLETVISPSTERIKPACSFFGKCGGCQLMHLDYAQQLLQKRELVTRAIQRIGKLDDIYVAPCVPSPTPLGYRNKIQLPVSNSILGMYAHHTHKLVPIDRCLIHCDLGEKVFQSIRRLISQTKPSNLKHLLIRTAIHTEEVLVVLVTNTQERLHGMANRILEQCPQVKGVLQNVNLRKDNVIFGEHFHTLAGKSSITETLSGLNFKLSAASFFQVNTLQAEQLYALALEAAELKPTDTAIDAFCGIGTLTLLISKKVKEVIGIENVIQAVADAQENALLNQISNAHFLHANAEKKMHELDPADVVFLNPPRKGCAPELLETLSLKRPRKIVYISCDPGTLARDLAFLKERGFFITEIQPVDMFPQTAHVECVATISDCTGS